MNDHEKKESLSVREIKAVLTDCSPEELPDRIVRFGADPREGVQKLLQAAEKRYGAYEKELSRLEEMKRFERLYPECRRIGGIDEVGRGPLAGPVVAACVILPQDCRILYLNDSKQLSEKKREQLYDEIMEKAVSVGVGCVEHTVIDEINILQATYEAMRQALARMEIRPDRLLVDAVTIPGIGIPQRGIVHGDARSVSIAAASIVAKVTRDRMMAEFDRQYPGYDFASNKGYGSAKHIAALKELGPCPIHRRTFIGNFVEV